MTAAIWCKDHVPTKTIVHRMHDIVDADGTTNALQLYVRTFKQADLTLTGTVRKATLVHQSTKVASQTSTVAVPNRRSSTNTLVNGHANGRGTALQVKLEDVPHNLVKADTRTCVTCDVDVSPKWWPLPPRVNTPAVLPNGIHHPSQGHPANGLAQENGQIALAAAALHQNVRQPEKALGMQCHQCHWNKKQKEPTPPPPAPVQEVPRAPVQTSSAMSASPREVPQPMPQPPPQQYSAWPPPPAYQPNGAYNHWQRQSPSSQPAPSAPMAHQMNGTHSPPVLSRSALLAQPRKGNGHGTIYTSAPARQNGHGPQPQPNVNGYPPSPRHHPEYPPQQLPQQHQTQNGAYGQYTSTRPSPQHLTNGGPPPRALEQNRVPENGALPNQNGQNASLQNLQPRPAFGTSHGSGSPSNGYREVRPHPPAIHAQHDPNNSQAQSNNTRPAPPPVDARVNGGASASPSLRNLLS